MYRRCVPETHATTHDHSGHSLMSRGPARCQAGQATAWPPHLLLHTCCSPALSGICQGVLIGGVAVRLGDLPACSAAGGSRHQDLAWMQQ